MPQITIYNDSDSDLDADFDVIELINGKEIARTTMEAAGESGHPKGFRLFASNQMFLILPRGFACPEMKLRVGSDGRQIDARPRTKRRRPQSPPVRGAK